MDYRERWELKDYLIGQTLERRVLLIHIALIVMLGVFLLDFWYLQGVHGDEFAHLAENNRLRRIPMPPTRGVVFDRNREVIAATRPSLNLVLLREERRDLDAQLRLLAPILGTTYEALAERLERAQRRPPYESLVLTEDVRLEELARIEARRELFPSVEVRETARRSYPDGALFGHVLGYVGEVGERQLSRAEGTLRLGDIIGKTGIERTYDPKLRGARGWNLVTVNNLGRPAGEEWVGREPEHGSAMALTLDVHLQRALVEGLGRETGAGVFLDPWTGEVLALASSPAFDPNVFADGISTDAWQAIIDDPRRPLLNRAISSKYAPGSTFKVLVAIAALESGTVTPEETIDCNGSTTIYGRRRLCWKRAGHGPVDLRAALAHSCNVYFYHVGRRLGIDTIQEFGARFGLGRRTGIDLSGESEGVLPSREWKERHKGERWYPGDTISVAIGQGLLAVTPLQMATAISAVATDGWLPHPRIAGGEARPPVRLGLTPSRSRLIREALHEAVLDGTGRLASLPDVEVAGKTGTAQVYRHSAGIDADDLPKEERDHAWFVGYAPADEPKIAFAVVVEHGGHGGTSAAPIVRRVLEVFFAPPDAEGGNDERRMRTRGITPDGEADAGAPAAG